MEPCILDSVQLTWGAVVALGMVYWSGVVLHTVLVGQLEEEEEKREVEDEEGDKEEKEKEEEEEVGSRPS